MVTARRRVLAHADLTSALQAHEDKDEDRHAEVMRFVGATEQYIKTSEKNVSIMFQGIADLTKLIGSTRETVAEENGKNKGKSQSNQAWVVAVITLGAAVLGSGATVALMLAFHVH